MKYYIVTHTRINPKTLEEMDSWSFYEGFDKESALKEYENQIIDYEKSTAHDRLHYRVTFQEHDLPEYITAESDKDDINEALCECFDYDGEEYYKPI